MAISSTDIGLLKELKAAGELAEPYVRTVRVSRSIIWRSTVTWWLVRRAWSWSTIELLGVAMTLSEITLDAWLCWNDEALKRGFDR
jgi:hypothetical protein